MWCQRRYVLKIQLVLTPTKLSFISLKKISVKEEKPKPKKVAKEESAIANKRKNLDTPEIVRK